MKFIDKIISPSFAEIYLILDNKEKLYFYNNVKKIYLEYKQNLIKTKIKIYNTISKKTDNAMSMDMIRKLNQELKYLTLDTIYLKDNEIAEGLAQELSLDIINHIDNLNLTQVFNNETNIIGNVNDNNSITLVYSFVYVNKDYNLTFPKVKGNAYLFTKQDLDMVETEILLGTNNFSVVDTNKVSEFSDITFNYKKGDIIQKNAIMDVATMEMSLNIDRKNLVNLDKSLHILKNNDMEEFTLEILEIKDKVVYPLTDEIVKKINFLDTKTVSEFRLKIKEIYSFVLNVNSNVMSILKNMASINKFEIDEYVLRHFAKKLQVKYDKDEILKNINEINIGFITSLIFSKYNINIDKYIGYIENEFALISKMKKISGNKSFDDYFNMKAPMYALYDFFMNENLITERR